MNASRNFLVWIFLFSVVPIGPASAQTDDLDAILIRDINETPFATGVFPSGLTPVGSRLFFVSQLDLGQLWVTDGTEAGSRILEAPRPVLGTQPSNLADGGDGTLYFSRVDGTGRDLWKSDGTLAGTVKIKEIHPGVNPLGSSDPGGFTRAGGVVYFSADDGVHGRELWKTDGTEDGTVLVKDVTPGPDDGGVASITALGDIVLFARQTSRIPLHEELWRSDGTEAGTEFLRGFNPGGFADVTPITVLGGELFFTVNDAIVGPTLWKSDGTAGGTVDLGIVPANVVGRVFVPVGGFLVYLFDGDPSPGFELYRFDPATDETAPISPINWSGGGSTLVGNFTDVGGMFYFTGDDGSTGFEIWRHDFAAGETVTVTDFNPEPSAGPQAFRIQDLTDVEGTLFFAGGSGEMQIWMSDGTAAGTVEIVVNPEGTAFPTDLTSFGGELFFAAQRPRTNSGGLENTPRELWKTDGTEAGTVELRLGDEETLSSFPNPAAGVVVGSDLYFAADDFPFSGGDLREFNVELWKSDGTPGGTVRVVDLHPEGSSRPTEFTEAFGLVFFLASDGTTGTELWSHDPATGITERRTDLDPNGGSLNPPVDLIPVGGSLYFVANDGTGGRLWRLDIVTGDVEPAADVAVSPIVPEVVLVGTALLFPANDGGGVELWRHETSDGTTEQFLDINPTGGSSPRQLTLVGDDTLFFTAREDAAAPEVLWKTELSTGATVAIDVRPGGNAFARSLLGFGNSLYFVPVTDAGAELWRHDLTANVTEQLTDFPLDAASPQPLVGFAGKLFFSGIGTSGHALYAHDPVAGGVELIADPAPLSNTAMNGFGGIVEAVVVGDTLFFTANVGGNVGGVAGLWMTDGTPEGSSPLPFDDLQAFSGLADVNGELFFAAAALGIRGELFKLGTPTEGDEEAPSVSGVVATPNPVQAGDETVLSANGSDVASGGSVITGASYSIDGGAPMAMAAADGAFDSPVEDVVAALVFDVPDDYEVCVTVSDAAGNTSEPVCTTVAVVVPDTEAPFVSGLDADPNPAAVGESVDVSATIDDTAAGGSNIVEALLVVDGGDPIAMEASDGAFDGPLETARAELAFAEAGQYELCVVATDSAGNVSDPECILLTVLAPNEPPDCSAAVLSETRCWPPNHRFVLTEIVGVVDPEGGPIAIEVLGITQDEPVRSNGQGSGQTCPDGVFVDTNGNGRPDAAAVRCERNGTGNGRVYTIRFVAADDQGDTCEGSLTFCVPHDARPGAACVDDGGAYDSTRCPEAQDESLDRNVLTLEEFELMTPEPLFLRGDVNWDDRVDIGDCVQILDALFQDAAHGALDCRDAADTNDDGAVEISDVVSVLSYLFLGGRSPPPPIAAIGEDPTGDGLDCD